MKKSFFQKTYNININLLISSIISLSFSFFMHLLIKTIDQLNIPSLSATFTLLQNKLELAELYSKLLTVILLVIVTTLIFVELFQRYTNDTIFNFAKSAYQTICLRHFLKQDENSESVISIDSQTTVTKFNPILKSFNKTISKCSVDVRKKEVIVFIKYPRTQQAQHLLREIESHIKEEISSRNPDYYFSSPYREGNKLWFIGTRR